ncbi:MAG: hypothetical protein IJD92_02820 [Bacilli bacterium]|nr:hypothetical protein [Bacilli bacterium]
MENTLNIDNIEKKDKHYVLPLNFKTNEEKLFLVRNINNNFANYILISENELYEYGKSIIKITSDTKNVLLSDLKRIRRLAAAFIIEGKVKNNKLYISQNFFEKIALFLKQSQYQIDNNKNCRYNSIDNYKIIYISEQLKEKSIKL